MTIRQALAEAQRRLARAGVPEARLDAQTLLAHCLGTERLVMLSLMQEEELSAAQKAQFEAMLSRRRKREPLQYILGHAWFMGHPFRVRSGVLIPRQDTEILCQRALDRLRPGGEALDLCTGSGCLAVSLKLACRKARLTAVDIEQEAVALARQNARALGAQVDILLGDLFAPVSGRRFGLILSNPPYVPRADLAGLQEEVRIEPVLALDGGEDGLDFYRRIIHQAPGHLHPGGFLLLELGHGQAEAVAGLLPPGFSNPVFVQDLSGIPRVLETQWSGGVH